MQTANGAGAWRDASYCILGLGCEGAGRTYVTWQRTWICGVGTRCSGGPEPRGKCWCGEMRRWKLGGVFQRGRTTTTRTRSTKPIWAWRRVIGMVWCLDVQYQGVRSDSHGAALERPVACSADMLVTGDRPPYAPYAVAHIRTLDGVPLAECDTRRGNTEMRISHMRRLMLTQLPPAAPWASALCPLLPSVIESPTELQSSPVWWFTHTGRTQVPHTEAVTDSTPGSTTGRYRGAERLSASRGRHLEPARLRPGAVRPRPRPATLRSR